MALMAVAALLSVAACDEVTTDIDDDNNTPPVAVAATNPAGDVLVETAVTLDGSGSSDADGDQLSFSWAFASVPTGSGATLNGADAATGSFTPDAVGEYAVELTVSDGLDSDTDVVTVVATNTAPVAVALPTDTTVAVGATVELDGSQSSDADGHTLSFSWELETPAGSAAAVTDPDNMSTSFTPDVAGEFLAIFSVSDGFDTALDTAIVTAVEPNDPPSIVAVGTEGDIAFDIAHTVWVEATDPDGDELTYEWRLIEGPGDISFPDANFNTTSDTAEIVLSAVGTHFVEVSVSDGFTTVADTLEFEAHDPVIDAHVTTDRTLPELLNSPYMVSGNQAVTAALTIEPGARLEFASGAGLYAETEGSISAVGTAAKQIVFTGMVETPGSWLGLGIRSNNTVNELTHVEIAYGGGGSLYSIAGDGNVGVENGARIKITNASIHNSGAAGVYTESSAELPGFAENTISSNTGAPVRIPFRLMGALDGGSSYSDNTEAYVDVYGANVSSAMAVAALDVPYRIGGNPAVAADMTIAPGARFEFASTAGFYVETAGSLSAVGEAGSPIVFSGVQEVPGYWLGIGFRSNNVLNELTHVEVAHGGSGSQHSIVVTGNVGVENGARVTVTNSTFRDGGQYGLATESNANLPGFSANTFENNAAGQVRIPMRLAGQMDSGSSFSVGAKPFVHVFDSSVASDAVLSKLDAPYRIGGNSAISGAMIIDPGAVLEFESNAGMYAETDGSISAVGTEADTIVITGVQKVSGSWRGLGFRSNNLLNELTYVSIGYGGSDSQYSIGFKGNVAVETGARLAITNSVIHNSADHGVALESTGILTDFSANRFEGNTTSSVHVPMPMAGMLDSASEFAPDVDAHVSIYDGTVTAGMTFSKLDAPYRVSGNSAFRAAVTADPGAHFEFTSESGFYADTEGSFAAVGTATDSIRFVGVQEVAGAWKGIGFRSNNTANQLTYVEVGHGGSSTQYSITGTANIGIDTDARLSVTEARIHDSAGWGIWAAGSATVTATSVTYSSNASGDQNF